METENSTLETFDTENSQTREMAALALASQIKELPPIVTKDLSEKDKIVRTSIPKLHLIIPNSSNAIITLLQTGLIHSM